MGYMSGVPFEEELGPITGFSRALMDGIDDARFIGNGPPHGMLCSRLSDLTL